ncbi:MAG: glyoxylate/hydroxypyruvate reductase A [Rubrivivax sp.]|nr:glyoxylate/hydroxypyruvate reductase A [Rubrivivax sp.]
MKVLLCGQWGADEARRWQNALAAAMPEAVWLAAEDLSAADHDIEAAVVANPAPGQLAGLPRLRLIQSLWAGVDRLLADASLPAQVPVARMVDPAMTAAMVETALWATLALHRGFFAYRQRQNEALWQVHAQRRADEIGVLVLGQGVLGRAVAARLTDQGYRVSGWQLGGVDPAEARRALDAQLPQADIVVNLLPLTPHTRDLIDARFLSRLPTGASLVNLARGAHVVDADLLAALDRGALRHAVLDVFRSEPLPPEHAFWRHPRVTVLPHAAALTDERSAAAMAVSNLRALRDGRPLANLVNRLRGY